MSNFINEATDPEVQELLELTDRTPPEIASKNIQELVITEWMLMSTQV